MIKKILLGLGITFLFFIGFSSAYFYPNVEIDLPGTFYYGGTDLNEVTSALNLFSDYGNYLHIIDRGWENNEYYVFWNNGKLYTYGYYSYQGGFYLQGYYTQFCKVVGTGWCANNFSEDVGNEFYNLFLVNFTKFIGSFQAEGDDPGFCFYNSINGINYCAQVYDEYNNVILTGSLNIPNGTTDFSNYAQYSPFYYKSSGGGDNGGGSSSEVVGITPGSTESALNYYENVYGWDSSICYAGVDSLDYLYGQNGVSYDSGTGLSIFEVYEGLYGNENNKHDFLLYTSRWLNSWLINFNQWFDTGGDPDWIASYNSGSHLVDYIFTGFSFPFANQPVAIYFLTDNIQSQTEQVTQGEEVVSYCNIKINSGTFDEIIGTGNKNNIINNTEQRNTNVGLNPDGSKHEYTGAFLGSGVNLAFSGNLSIKNTLKNFFDELGDSMNINADPGIVGILPGWLIVAFLTIMLFKFFRKKS